MCETSRPGLQVQAVMAMQKRQEVLNVLQPLVENVCTALSQLGIGEEDLPAALAIVAAALMFERTRLLEATEQAPTHRPH